MKDYIELTKPRIKWLIMMSTGLGYYCRNAFGPSKACIRKVLCASVVYLPVLYALMVLDPVSL